MLNRFIKPMLAIALTVGMFLPGSQSALADSAPAASSPEKPLAYSASTWQTIQPGEWQWYAFKYNHTDVASDQHKNQTDANDTVVPAGIQLFSRPLDGVTLMLLNGEQIKAWEHGDVLAGFGAATDVYNEQKISESLARFCKNNGNDPACPTGGGTGVAGSRCVNRPDASDPTARCETLLDSPLGYANWSGDLGATGTYYILVRRAANANGPAQYRFTINGDGVTVK